VALFTDIEPDQPRRRSRVRLGWILVSVAVVAIVAVAVIPAPYVIERPGPVYDVLGEVTIDGDQTPLIQIPGEENYPTTGTLDMLTVSLRGNPDSLPSWFEIAAAYVDDSQAILPVASVYPPGVTVEDSNESGRIEMENSQREAIAAALTELGYDFPSTLTVASTTEGSPSDGVLQEGDVVTALNGESFADVSGLREAIAANGTDAAARVTIERDGAAQTVELTPELSDTAEPTAVIGVLLQSDYEFPVDVSIQLENVGGPSAGMMFALGIIDKLTPGALTGGDSIAGTGTIDAAGEVGGIGGIVQKMYGAEDAGADWFLAPAANCGEVVGNEPDGIQVIRVATLDDAVTALETISEGGDTSALPACVAG